MLAFSRPVPDPAVVARMRVWGGVCASVVIVVGVTVLLGWIFHVSQMMTVAAGITMKANTSVGFILLGIALLLLGDPTPPLWARVVGTLFALVGAAIGLATLSEHLFGLDLGIDELLFREAPGAIATASPNRMGPPAAVCFALIGVALVLNRRSALGQGFIQAFALTSVFVATLPILGYVFQVQALFGIARFTGIALHTAITLAVLGLGVLFARPETGVMAQFASADAGGLTLRRLLPACIIVPVLFNWLRVLGQDAGLYDATFGRTLLTLAFIGVFSVLTFWTAATVSRQAAARARAEEAEVRMKDQLLQALENERTARETAEQSNRMKDEFLATLSHELRTPLHAILGWAHLLAQGALSPTDTKRAVDTIQRNAHLQAQLVNDLLDMSGIASGKLRLELQDLLLPSVIDAALSTATPAAEAKGVRVERRVERVRAVRGDPARIQQVLWNLIANAIKFTPAGGRVTVSARESGTQAEVAVNDTGIGIAPELLGHVFERFHQADSSITRQHGGLGLGLAIARQLAEMHGGTLEAASRGVGQGATFTLRLPLAHSRPDVEAGASSVGGETPRDGMLAGVRVLVVEDDPDARELIGRMLEDRRAEVHPVAGTSEALDALVHSRFDVIVSDIAMPDRDGHELIRTLRARGDELPAIALSAFASERDGDIALKAGFQLHLTKPVTAEVLASAVARLASGSTPVQDD